MNKFSAHLADEIVFKTLRSEMLKFFVILSLSTMAVSAFAQTYCKLTSSKVLELSSALGGQSFYGYGCNATGGLGGTTCQVTRGTDSELSPVAGMLRYCVEKRGLSDPSAPIIITFHPDLAGKFIRLEAPLSLRPNTTIDGRMPANALPVTISHKRIVMDNPCHPDILDPKNVPSICDPVSGNPGLLKNSAGQIPRYVWRTNVGNKAYLFLLRNDDYYKKLQNLDIENIIITDLTFRADMPDNLPLATDDLNGKSAFPNPCAVSNSAWKSPSAIANPREVTGCPVMIEMGVEDYKALKKTQKIVIANSDFSFCGNKCIVGNDSADGITIVRNHFHESFFAVLLGMKAHVNLSRTLKPDYGIAPLSRYTFYQNHFEKVLRRNPRCASFVNCHVHSNVVENWGSPSQTGFGIAVESGGWMVAEWNFFSDASLDQTSFTSKNPAVHIQNSFGVNLDDSQRDPSIMFLGRVGLVKNGIVESMDGISAVIDPNPNVTGDVRLFATDGELKDSKGKITNVKPFIPSNDYKYSPLTLSKSNYDSVINGAGPRTLP